MLHSFAALPPVRLESRERFSIEFSSRTAGQGADRVITKNLNDLYVLYRFYT
ncbi:hypothetical protein BN2497_3207 [Janthinobacterium sp. CG23_2]|nr:hypothetical protein BN2497_3207 [Janthinobacterium sp. CG23_2]CUU28001.1 hypothetical protein BN3177_3207 [Janthinobacterium sp. CG23_2]